MEKKQVQKIALKKYLYTLNQYIQQVKRKNDFPYDADVKAELLELYNLKEAVILKMLSDGLAHILAKQKCKNAKNCFYVFRTNREMTFHLPITEKVIEAVNAFENNKDLFKNS